MQTPNNAPYSLVFYFFSPSPSHTSIHSLMSACAHPSFFFFFFMRACTYVCVGRVTSHWQTFHGGVFFNTCPDITVAGSSIRLQDSIDHLPWMERAASDYLLLGGCWGIQMAGSWQLNSLRCNAGRPPSFCLSLSLSLSLSSISHSEGNCWQALGLNTVMTHWAILPHR